MSRPPSLRALLTALLRGAVRLYQLVLRPVLGPNCRFEPSCSDYALQALSAHGPGRGSAMTAWRLLRCNPWHPGGHDPVPTHRAVPCGCLSLLPNRDRPAR